MWTAAHSVDFQDGRLPELGVGDRVNTDLNIYLSDNHAPTGTKRITRLGSREARYQVEGEVIDFADRPKLWLIDAGDAVLLPSALALLTRPAAAWVRVSGTVWISEYGYRNSPGYRSWQVREIVSQRRPKAGGPVHEEEIEGIHKWTDARRGFQTRYLLDLVDPQAPR